MGRMKKVLNSCLMFCFSPHCRMDRRSKALRPGERLVPLGTCGTHLQQTCTTEEPEGGTTCEECQAAGLLQEIRLVGHVQSPCHGETIFFLLCLRRNASVKSIIQHFDRIRCFLPKKVGIQPGEIFRFFCVTRTTATAVGGKKVACIACFVIAGRDFN